MLAPNLAQPRCTRDLRWADRLEERAELRAPVQSGDSLDGCVRTAVEDRLRQSVR
jgi:hypothetical protein